MPAYYVTYIGRQEFVSIVYRRPETPGFIDSACYWRGEGGFGDAPDDTRWTAIPIGSAHDPSCCGMSSRFEECTMIGGEAILASP
jgi:hypothetical protein